MTRHRSVRLDNPSSEWMDLSKPRRLRDGTSLAIEVATLAEIANLIDQSNEEARERGKQRGKTGLGTIHSVAAKDATLKRGEPIFAMIPYTENWVRLFALTDRLHNMDGMSRSGCRVLLSHSGHLLTRT